MAPDVPTTTRSGRVLLGLAVLCGLPLLAARGSGASESDPARATLQGWPGVCVVVEAVAPAVERAGRTTHQLHTEVERQLQQAGLRLLTQAAWPMVIGPPVVDVQVHVVLPPHGQAAYHISTECYQRASLAAQASSALVATWTTADLGVVDVAALPTRREHVRASVDQFRSADESVNPRPTARAPLSSAPPRRALRREAHTVPSSSIRPHHIGTLAARIREWERRLRIVQGRPSGSHGTESGVIPSSLLGTKGVHGCGSGFRVIFGRHPGQE
jgi:hypothetical protein